MSRWIGVRIEHPRIQYTEQSTLTKACSRSRTYAAVSSAQTEAEVELHVVQLESGRTVSLRKLHTFYVRSLPVSNDKPPEITLSTVYDGRRQLTAAVLVNGSEVDRVELKVAPEERRRYLLLLPLLLFLLAGGFLGLRSLLTDDTTQPTRESHSIAGQPAPDEPEQPAPDEPELVQPDEPETAEPSAPVVDPETEPIDIDEEFTVYFAPNQTFLTEEAQTQLREIAELLQQAPEARVSMVGHTAIFGVESEQLEISRLRVMNARDFLQDAGWQPEVVPQLNWRGPTEPVTRDIDRQHINRRVEIDISTRD